MPASLRVYTYKDGLLARLAHDLQLTLERFEVELARGSVRARFELASLRVDGVMRKGGLAEGALSDRDREQILKSARDEVLEVSQHPEARFEGQLSSAGSSRLVGSLTLRGRAETQEVQLTLGDQEAVARARLVPSRWGIPPFKALGGAIKLQDAIDVELRLPREAAVPQGDWGDLEHHFGVGSASGHT